MIRNLLGAAALLCLVALQSQAADEKKADKSDKDKLQGTWEVVSYEFMGKTVPVPKGMESSMTFEGEKVIMKDPKKSENGTYKLDDSKKPKEIDLTGPKDNDPTKTETMKAIYTLDGDTLKLAMKGPPGAERPKGFDEKEIAVMNLKRVKK